MRRYALLFSAIACACRIETGQPSLSSSSSTTSSTSNAVTTSDIVDSSGGDSTGEGTGTMTGSIDVTTDDATTDATDGDSSTGSPAAVCGDDIVAPGEECDDGNEADDDGCNRSCKRDRIVFATSKMFSPGSIQGLEGADGICTQLAAAAGLERPSGFTAWMSDSNTDAIDRVFHGEGRYVRADGQRVAANFIALLQDREAAIETDEYGLVVGAGAWTGTLPDGRRVPNSKHCLDWTTDDPFTETGYYGHCTTIDSRWTYESNPITSPSSCSEQLRIYCFEGP